MALSFTGVALPEQAMGWFLHSIIYFGVAM